MQDVKKKYSSEGKFNRIILKAQEIIYIMGHSARRFERNYSTGVATYTCPDCGLTAVVNIGRDMAGDALNTNCIPTKK